MGVKITTKLKGIFLLLTISTILSACGPSACDCAKLAEKVGVYNGGLWLLNTTPSQKAKLQRCAEKYDGLNNARLKCRN